MKVKKWLLGKLALFVGVISVCLLTGASLNLLPKPICELLAWGSANFYLLSFLFVVACCTYVASKIFGGRRQQ